MEDCSVCFLKLDEDSQLIHCGHKIHKECFNSINRVHGICPQCENRGYINEEYNDPHVLYSDEYSNDEDILDFRDLYPSMMNKKFDPKSLSGLHFIQPEDTSGKSRQQRRYEKRKLDKFSKKHNFKVTKNTNMTTN